MSKKTDKTPTWCGRHGRGAMKAHRDQKRIDAAARRGEAVKFVPVVAPDKQDGEYFDA